MCICRYQIPRPRADAHQAVVVVVHDAQHPAKVLGVELMNRADYSSLAFAIHEFTSIVLSRAPEPYVIHAFNNENCAFVNHSHHLDLGRNRARILVPI